MGCRHCTKGTAALQGCVQGQAGAEVAEAVRSRLPCSCRPDGEGWHLQGPLGAELLHHPELWDALQAGAAPLLAVYLVLPQHAPFEPMCCWVPQYDL